MQSLQVACVKRNRRCATGTFVRMAELVFRSTEASSAHAQPDMAARSAVTRYVGGEFWLNFDLYIMQYDTTSKFKPHDKMMHNVRLKNDCSFRRRCLYLVKTKCPSSSSIGSGSIWQNCIIANILYFCGDFLSTVKCKALVTFKRFTIQAYATICDGNVASEKSFLKYMALGSSSQGTSQ